jgi:ATP-dependent protease HslVU (ClpYQ) peptidase subunit
MIKVNDGKDRSLFNAAIINFYAGLTARYFARQTRYEQLNIRRRSKRDDLEKLVHHLSVF